MNSDSLARIVKDNYLPNTTENIFKERPIMGTSYSNYTAGSSHSHTMDALGTQRAHDAAVKAGKKARRNITLWKKAWPKKIKKGTAVRWRGPSRAARCWRVAVHQGEGVWTGTNDFDSHEAFQDYCIRQRIEPGDLDWMKR